MSGELLIEDVFAVSFVEGVMVVGLASGDIFEGNQVSVTAADGGRIVGEVGAFHIHWQQNDPPERVRLSLRGPLASVVKPGDVVVVNDLRSAPNADSCSRR